GASREGRSGRHAGAGQEGGPARTRSPVEDAGRGRRVHGVAHVSRLARRAPVGAPYGRFDRPETDQGGARRRSLRAREGEGSRARVSRGTEAEPGREGTDPLLPRPSRGRQDLACALEDRKSTRLNSSHVKISYAVFRMKKKLA